MFYKILHQRSQCSKALKVMNNGGGSTPRSQRIFVALGPLNARERDTTGLRLLRLLEHDVRLVLYRRQPQARQLACVALSLPSVSLHQSAPMLSVKVKLVRVVWCAWMSHNVDLKEHLCSYEYRAISSMTKVNQVSVTRDFWHAPNVPSSSLRAGSVKGRTKFMTSSACVASPRVTGAAALRHRDSLGLPKDCNMEAEARQWPIAARLFVQNILCKGDKCSSVEPVLIPIWMIARVKASALQTNINTAIPYLSADPNFC